MHTEESKTVKFCVRPLWMAHMSIFMKIYELFAIFYNRLTCLLDIVRNLGISI